MSSRRLFLTENLLQFCFSPLKYTLYRLYRLYRLLYIVCILIPLVCRKYSEMNEMKKQHQKNHTYNALLYAAGIQWFFEWKEIFVYWKGE